MTLRFNPFTSQFTPVKVLELHQIKDTGLGGDLGTPGVFTREGIQQGSLKVFLYANITRADAENATFDISDEERGTLTNPETGNSGFTSTISVTTTSTQLSQNNCRPDTNNLVNGSFQAGFFNTGFIAFNSTRLNRFIYLTYQGTGLIYRPNVQDGIDQNTVIRYKHGEGDWVIL